MKNDEFEKYKYNYKEVVDESVSFSGQDLEFFTDVKADLLKSYLYSIKLENPKILDLGCGVGTTDSKLKHEFKTLSGCDVSAASLERAKEVNPEVEYSLYDSNTLPFESESFDVVFTINVMHHVPPVKWDQFLLEAKRVLKKDGKLIVFEHNPFKPLTLKAVRDCPFDKDAVLLNIFKMNNLIKNAGLKVKARRFILFFSFKGKVFRFIEKLLFKCPLGAQYYVVGSKEL